MKILVSSNDMGSTRQYASLINYAKQSEYDFEFTVLGTNLTKPVFENVCTDFKCIDILSENKSSEVETLIEKHFEEHDPDFVFVGLASESYNLDDTVLYVAKKKKIKTGAIQDYCGYLGNWSKNHLPDLFFVMNDLAKDLTEKRSSFDVSCIVSGLPKYKDYEANNFKQSKDNSEVKEILFVGQPKSISGVLDNLKYFISALIKINDEVVVNYRIHPEDCDSCDFYEKLFSTQPHQYRIINFDELIEQSLVETDLLVTCYSTAGVDHNFLQFYSDAPLGNLLYVCIGNEVKEVLQTQIGMEKIPSTFDGLGVYINNEDRLVDAIKDGLYNEDLRQSYYECAKKSLSNQSSVCEIILNYIKQEQFVG